MSPEELKEQRRAIQKRFYSRNKDAINAKRKAVDAANPEPRRKAKLKYLFKYPERRICKAAKQNAKTRNLEFNLEESDIIIPDVCPVFGVPFEYGTNYAASIDRIDNSKGYIKGNIQIISRRANVMKYDASPEELQKFANWILK